MDRRQRFDARDALSASLGDLSDRKQAAIVCRYYEDLPDARIAEILGADQHREVADLPRLDVYEEEIHRD